LKFKISGLVQMWLWNKKEGGGMDTFPTGQFASWNVSKLLKPTTEKVWLF
jgi:hypothetical protein